VKIKIIKEKEEMQTSHQVLHHHDDSENGHPGFCSVISNGVKLHQADVRYTGLNDYRWRVFERTDNHEIVVYDSDLASSYDEACEAAFSSYVKMHQTCV